MCDYQKYAKPVRATGPTGIKKTFCSSPRSGFLEEAGVQGQSPARRPGARQQWSVLPAYNRCAITEGFWAISGFPLSAKSDYAGRQACQEDCGINRSAQFYGHEDLCRKSLLTGAERNDLTSKYNLKKCSAYKALLCDKWAK